MSSIVRRLARLPLGSVMAIGVIASGFFYVLFKLPYRSDAIPPLASVAGMTLLTADGEYLESRIAEEDWSRVLSATRRRGVLAGAIEKPTFDLWPMATIQVRDVQGDTRYLVVSSDDDAVRLAVWGTSLELYDYYRLETAPALFDVLTRYSPCVDR